MSSPKKESDNPTNSVNDDQIRRSQLQMQFHGTRREDFQTIEAYVEKLKSVANSLAEMESQISDSDMVLQLLAGLPNEYLPLKNTISSTCPLPNFEEACSMLYMQEDILLQNHDSGDGGAEQSSGFFTKEKFYAAMDTLGTGVAVVGTLGTLYAAAGTLGTAVGTVAASRMIVVGAVGAISALAGWKFGKHSVPKTEFFFHRLFFRSSRRARESTMSLPSEKTIDSGSDDETIITTQQLKMQFHSTRKGDLETIESYVNNLKSIADSLAANDNPLSDPDLVLQLLAGLPSPQYLPYQNRISSQFPLPDFSTACSLLYMYESLLQEQQKANSTNNDSPDSEEGNYNSNNNTSNKEIFDKILGVFDTVSNVVTTAWDVYSMFGTSSTANTMGNKKYTRRRNGRRGRR